MFDECFERRVDWSAIQALSVTREAFLAFFYQPPTEQKFSFLRCLEIIDKVRPLVWSWHRPLLTPLRSAAVGSLGQT